VLQTLAKRKYALYYSPSFAGGERVQLVKGLDFFTENKGFRRMEIDEIESMDPMDSINLYPLKVWRIE
jgi:hypothetical protein